MIMFEIKNSINHGEIFELLCSWLSLERNLHKMNLVNITKLKIRITTMRILIVFIQFTTSSNPHSFVPHNDNSPFSDSMDIYLSHSFKFFFLFLATLTSLWWYFANILRIPHISLSPYLIPNPRSRICIMSCSTLSLVLLFN